MTKLITPVIREENWQPNENYSLNFENIENRYMSEHANTYTKTVVEESDDLS